MMPRLVVFWFTAVSITLMLGWLSKVISWLNELPSGEQALAVSAIGLGATVAWWVFKTLGRLLGTAVANWWRTKREASLAEHQRLTPQRKMSLSDAYTVQPQAIAVFNQATARMSVAVEAFRRDTDTAVANMAAAKAITPPKFTHLMNGNAVVVDRYTDAIAKDVSNIKKAFATLDGAWSSRMYWHETRGSAADILDADIPATVSPLLQSARTIKDTFSGVSEKLVGLEGWTDKLDKSVKRHRKVTADLLAAFTDFERMCETILSFHRTHSGWRGRLRRAVLRRKR